MPRHERPNPETDPYRPPAIPTEVCCLHCGQEYESYLIQWQEEVDERGRVHGFWCCPTPYCGGRGFGFDIFPTDPEYCGEDGELMWSHREDAIEDDDESLEGEVWLEEFDVDAFLVDDEPFNLGLPPLPGNTPPPLELDGEEDASSSDAEPPAHRRGLVDEDEDDIPF